MANELAYSDITGLTVTANLYAPGGTAISSGLSMPESASSGTYWANMPGSSATVVHVEYLAGGTKWASDTFYWDGSQRVDLSDLATSPALATAQADLDIITGADGVNLLSATQASIDAIEADTNELQTDDVPGLISVLNDLSAADVNAEVDTALSDYDPPTKAEMDTAHATTDALISGLNDPTAATIADAVWDETLADHVTAGSTGKALSDIDSETSGLATSKSVTIVDAVNGSTIEWFAADTWYAQLTLTGLTLTDYEAVAFVAKSNESDADSESVLYVRSDTDLQYVAGAVPSASTTGTLTVDSDTQITIQIDIGETSGATPKQYTWWLKVWDTTPSPDEGFTRAIGTLIIKPAGLTATA